MTVKFGDKTIETEPKVKVLGIMIDNNLNFDLHIGKIVKSLRKIESIQKRALRFLLDDDKSSYTELLSKSEKSSMNVNRPKTLCTEIFKKLNGLNPGYLQDVFQKSLHENNLIKPAVNTVTYGQKSLSSLEPLIWNKLPGHIKTSETVLAFKHALKFWNGEKCLCKMCEST